jgi:hypothetical protein
VPPELDLRLIVDNYATDKHPKVRTWLAQRPRYHMHFTPTYSSWLNQVERWFGPITQRDSSRYVHQRCRPHPENRRFRAALQPFESAFRLDRHCRFDPAEDRPTLFAYFRDTTLASSDKSRRSKKIAKDS